MKKIIIITIILLVTAAGIISISLTLNSHIDEKGVKEAFLRDYQEGYFGTEEGLNHISQLDYKKFSGGWYGIDFQFFYMPEGAKGPMVTRGILHTESKYIKLVATLPGGKITTKSPPEVSKIPDNIQKEIADWPPSAPVHENAIAPFDFYSGDLTETSRTKLTDWFVNATLDTRLSNMSVRKGSYTKTEDAKPSEPEHSHTHSHSHTHEKTFIRPAITTSFILDIKHPKSSYKVTQKAHKEAPSRDTLYLSCIDGGSDDDSEVNCGGDIKL